MCNTPGCVCSPWQTALLFNNQYLLILHRHWSLYGILEQYISFLLLWIEYMHHCPLPTPHTFRFSSWLQNYRTKLATQPVKFYIFELCLSGGDKWNITTEVLISFDVITSPTTICVKRSNNPVVTPTGKRETKNKGQNIWTLEVCIWDFPLVTKVFEKAVWQCKIQFIEAKCMAGMN